jgi:hypothetical protein
MDGIKESIWAEDIKMTARGDKTNIGRWCNPYTSVEMHPATMAVKGRAVGVINHGGRKYREDIVMKLERR